MEKIDRRSALAGEVSAIGYEPIEFVRGRGVRIETGIARAVSHSDKHGYTLRMDVR